MSFPPALVHAGPAEAKMMRARVGSSAGRSVFGAAGSAPPRNAAPQCSLTRGSVRRVSARASMSREVFHHPFTAVSCIL